MFATREEHEIADLADALGCSYGEAERAYTQPAPKPREPGPTKVKASGCLGNSILQYLIGRL